jgi:hypothetical protein
MLILVIYFLDAWFFSKIVPILIIFELFGNLLMWELPDKDQNNFVNLQKHQVQNVPPSPCFVTFFVFNNESSRRARNY